MNTKKTAASTDAKKPKAPVTPLAEARGAATRMRRRAADMRMRATELELEADRLEAVHHELASGNSMATLETARAQFAGLVAQAPGAGA